MVARPRPYSAFAGEDVAAPWRAYRDASAARARDRQATVDLDAILADAAAFGLASSLDRHLKEASARGYNPF